jgi:5-methyltetrahydrofolate--homocysteine methyltransferase
MALAEQPPKGAAMDLNALKEAIIAGDMKGAGVLTEVALQSGIPPQKVLTEALVPGMEVVGEKFRCNEVYVPEVLVSARAMKKSLSILKPQLTATGAKPVGIAVAGTVKGDLHDIGKNLVCMMLEGAGYQIVDLGTDVAPAKFVEAIQQKGVNVIALSALLTTTMPSMKSTIEAIKEAGLRDKVKIMIGGAPVTQRYADEIGADGYAPDAASAVDVAKSIG